MESSLSGSSAVTQQSSAVMANRLATPASLQLADHQQQQMHGCPLGQPVAQQQAAAPPDKNQDGGLQRLTAALTAVLSSGMASNYVEGLKPVLHNGKLAISTYIKLIDDPEPVFIGMFPNLPAAVAAQKQSQESVGQLPPAVARNLIAQQLAHTDPNATTEPQQSGSGRVPERWQSNTTSESTAVGAGSTSQAAAEEAGDATPRAPQQQQQQQVRPIMSGPQPPPQVQATSADVAQQQQQQHLLLQQQQQQLAQDSAEQADAAIQSALEAAAAAATGAQSHTGPTPRSVAAAVAGASPRQPPAALTDDVIRMLVHKGLHALAAAQHQQQHGEQGSSWQHQEAMQQQLQPHHEQEPSLRDVFNTPVSTPGSGMALAGTLQQPSSPYHRQPQHHGFLQQQQQQGFAPPQSTSSLGRLPGSSSNLDLPLAASMQQPLAAYTSHAAAVSAAGGLPPHSLPPLLPLVSEGGAGNVLSGDLGLALDGALHEAMLRGGAGPWAQTSAALAYSQAPVTYSAGFPVGHGQLGMNNSMQQQGAGMYGRQAGPSMPAAYGQLDARAGYGPAAGPFGGMDTFGGGAAAEFGAPFGMQQAAQFAGSGTQVAAGANFARQYDAQRAVQPAAPAAAAVPAAAVAAAAGGDGDEDEDAAVGDKRKRVVDPRVNCVKSVQYRVSRFPSELHDLCIEHWERARCARVVCNDVQGVMSVQNGRCVVTFNQNQQEVVKGVADYLRYAGEERIKKWRRHVRMVDFPRPGNRSGELMTAEEFLCIVGYQSEQGGGKRTRACSD